ncbi:hypothetical protein A1OK_11965 [Enterovibrio norvegicus FF-454]|uniref:RES domain-containing protein n=1 Tax=Enterovibrio norvegicus FF-454 TaxID=1185651 RepID=A0A1E5C3V1_9GAMM|nr:hypothetical protein [Enterovibrio norvegicus]OEE60193.1 hypothetical protein A1OK_11965 [Enterovibrio norvegicus FF-454]
MQRVSVANPHEGESMSFDKCQTERTDRDLIMIDELKASIKNFEAAKNTFSSDGLYLSLLDIVLFESIKTEIGNFRTGTFPMSQRIYPKGAKFTRIRKLDFIDHNFTYGDFWEPPKKYINEGRLNKKSEQLLYMTEGELMSPMKEVGIKISDKFIIMFYEARCDITLTEIGWNIIESNSHSEIGLLIKNFIDRIFSRKGSDAYLLSELVAKKINTSKAHGWCYPSIARDSGINVCLNVENKNYIELFGVQCCEMLENGKFITKAVCDVSDKESIVSITDPEQVKIAIEAMFNKFTETIDSAHLENYDTTVKYQLIEV